MSTIRLSAIAVATVGALLSAALSAVPAAADSHTPGPVYTAPAPTKTDRAGVDQDEYCIPQSGVGDAYTTYYADGAYAPTGCHPTGGAASVNVTTDPARGSWTFDYSTDPGPAPAADVFTVHIGACIDNPVGSWTDARRMASVTMTNTADAGGRYIRALSVKATPADPRDGGLLLDHESTVKRLADSQSATIELFNRHPGTDTPDWNNSGLSAGDSWTVRVYRSDLRDEAFGKDAYVVFEQVVAVPSCRMTRVKRGCGSTQVTITAHDYWSATPTQQFRIRMLNKKGKTVYRQPVPIATNTTKTIVLKKRALSKKVLAKGIPVLMVEQYDARIQWHHGGASAPMTHWGRDLGGIGDKPLPVWRTCKK